MPVPIGGMCSHSWSNKAQSLGEADGSSPAIDVRRFNEEACPTPGMKAEAPAGRPAT